MPITRPWHFSPSPVFLAQQKAVLLAGLFQIIWLSREDSLLSTGFNRVSSLNEQNNELKLLQRSNSA
jgi:hypothetical protein